MKTVTKAVQLTFNIKGYRVGECHHRAKISDAMVDIVYSLYEERNPDGTRRYGTRKICEITGIPRSTVCDIVSGRTRSQPIERARTVKVSIEVPDEG